MFERLPGRQASDRGTSGSGTQASELAGTSARELAFHESRAELTARIARPECERDAAVIEHDPSALLALPYHDGLALIAQERRALTAVRHALAEAFQLALRAAWPATRGEQRGELQLALRGIVADLAELARASRFRGVGLLSGECTMVGIQDGPQSIDYIVLGLLPCTPEALGVGMLDVGTPAAARAARATLREALELVDQAEAVVVSDLHELLDATRRVTS